MSEFDDNTPEDSKDGRRTVVRYAISMPHHYKEKLLQGFRGKGSAEYFRQYTNELWTPPYCEMTCAQFGAFRRILMLFTRDKQSLNQNFIMVTRKELKMHGISENLLKQIKSRTNVLDISLITDDGDFSDLDEL